MSRDLDIDDVLDAINASTLDGMTKLIARDLGEMRLEVAATIDLDKLAHELNERRAL